MYVAWDMRSSMLVLFTFMASVRAHTCRGAKIVVSIHWTLLTNFPFLHHPPVLHRLKTITKYRNMHARLRALHAHACTYQSQFILCFLYTSSNIVPSFIKIWLNLLEIWGFVFCSKLCARFHVLCVHARTCTCTNTFNQLRRPILKYAEDFMKIWLHLADILRCVTFVRKRDIQTGKQTQLKFVSDCKSHEKLVWAFTLHGLCSLLSQ